MNKVHRFISNDGFVINSNSADIKTSFQYIGLCDSMDDMMGTLHVLSPERLKAIKQMARNEKQLLVGMYNAIMQITTKKNPCEYMRNLAKSVSKFPMVGICLTAESLIDTLTDSKTQIVSWTINYKHKPYIATVWYNIL